MANPTMTIGDLRRLLAGVHSKHDHQPFVIWLPGSRIDVAGQFIVMPDEVMLEGNLRPGSVLS